MSGSGSSAIPAARSRIAASVETGSHTPSASSSSARSRSTARTGPSMTRRPAASSTTTRSTKSIAGVEVVLDEHDGVVALVRELARARRRPRRCPAGSRLAVGSSSTSSGRAHRQGARDREPLPAAARQPVGIVGASLPEADAPQGPLGACEHVGDRHPEVLGAERHLVEQRAGDQLRVGVLEDHARRACSARPPSCSRRRARRPRPCPRTSAGTACGMRPSSASVSVDLPDPLGPSRSTTSPGADVEAHGGGGGGILALVRDREIAHAEQGCGAVTPGRRRLRRGGRIALECGHGSSQER